MRKGTAYHEAGHAIAALVLSADDVSATIEDDEEFWGRADYSHPGAAPASRAIIVCAGPMAAWRVLPDDDDRKDCIEGRDVERLFKFVHQIDPNPDEEKPTVIALMRLADELLDEHWPSVVRVAEALLKSTSLNAAELLSLHTEH